MLDLVIAGGAVVTMDPARRVLRGGAIGVDGGRIVAVEADAAALPPARRTIDARGKIVMPGLVDSHGHAGHALTRGLGEGLDGDGWGDLVGRIYFHASDEAFWRAESDLAALERLRFGVTTSLSMPGSSPRVDDPRYALAALSGYRRLGLRHVVAAGPPNGPWPWRSTDQHADPPRERALDLDGALRVTGEIIEAVAALGDPKLRAYVGPSAICPEVGPGDTEPTEFARRQIAGVKRLVERHGTGLHAHAYRGMVRLAHAVDRELLGPHACLAHCAGIEADEVAILAKTGTAASHGPLTHAYAAARFPVVEALEAGVNVVVSTDGAAPDRSFDLLSQARIAAQLQRAYFGDTALLPAGRLLAMVTIDAARALALADQVGSLEVGKQADVVLVDARQAHLAPSILAPLRLVFAAAGQDVDTVVVAGEVLMEGRQVIGVDEAAILAAAEDALRATLGRAGVADPEALHPDTWHGVRYGPPRA